MRSEFETLALSRHDEHILLVTLNRPAVHNCVDGDTAARLGAAIEAFAADESAQVLVVTGAGRRAFCSGAYLKAIELRPSYADAYTALSRVYANSGQQTKATEILAKAAADNAAIVVAIFEHQHFVVGRLTRFELRVNRAADHPQSPLGIEAHLNRLDDAVRFRREKVHLETIRDLKGGEFCGRIVLVLCGKRERSGQQNCEKPFHSAPPFGCSSTA